MISNERDVVDLLFAASFSWNVMELVGNQSFVYDVTLDSYSTDLFVEIYSSGHGGEEFYYSNVPKNSSTTWLCGGVSTSFSFSTFPS